MNNTILFLDLDGTLNAHDATSIQHEKSTKPQCIGLLNEIINVTNCKIVLISNWAQFFGFNRICKLLYSRGIMQDTIIDSIKPVEIPDSSAGIVLGVVK